MSAAQQAVAREFESEGSLMSCPIRELMIFGALGGESGQKRKAERFARPAIRHMTPMSGKVQIHFRDSGRFLTYWRNPAPTRRSRTPTKAFDCPKTPRPRARRGGLARLEVTL